MGTYLYDGSANFVLISKWFVIIKNNPTTFNYTKSYYLKQHMLRSLYSHLIHLRGYYIRLRQVYNYILSIFVLKGNLSEHWNNITKYNSFIKALIIIGFHYKWERKYGTNFQSNRIEMIWKKTWYIRVKCIVLIFQSILYPLIKYTKMKRKYIKS